MKDRIEVGSGTYRIFQKPRGLFKLFQKFKPTDEAYANAIIYLEDILQRQIKINNSF